MNRPTNLGELLVYLREFPALKCVKHKLHSKLGPVLVKNAQENGLELERAGGDTGWILWDSEPADFTFDDRGFEVVYCGVCLRYDYLVDK